MTSEPILLTGNAHPMLAAAIASRLGTRVSRCRIEHFPDGEIAIELQESVRRREVFIVQPTSPPAGEHLLELTALADACRCAAADRLVAVIPWFGYARRGMGAAAARLLEGAGIRHVIALELHAAEIERFFRIPLDHLSAVPLLAGELQAMLPLDVAVVAASHGAHRLACEYAQILGAPVATIQRDIAGDVAGRPCLLVDDMIATGSTMISAAEAVLAAGAAPDLTVVATHAIFSEGTREKFELIDPIRRIVVTDSVPRAEGEWMKLRVVSVAPLLADAIAMAHAGLPVQKRYKPVEVG